MIVALKKKINGAVFFKEVQSPYNIAFKGLQIASR
jgi:hypothetical protein